MQIPGGKTVAVVGHSGCGKSTLIRLLYRFYNVNEGRILLNGHDVSMLTLDSMRQHMGVVPQDTVLFNDTIKFVSSFAPICSCTAIANVELLRYNIHYGNLACADEEVMAVAHKAQLHDAIMRMPKGYDTVVGERGLMISGGEKQRVAIARAMLKDAPILLCDEPTSSLDTRTEMELMGHLKSLGKKRTTLIIAHRLSTVQDADCIAVMNKGSVAELGSHRELMAENGIYAGMWKAQLAWDKEENNPSKQ